MTQEIDVNSPEVKALIKAAVDEATAPLLAKRDELLGENRKLKAGKTIDPADVTKLEDTIETLNADLKKANADLKTANTGVKTATDALGIEKAFTQKMLVENGLRSALSEFGVTDAVMMKAAMAILSPQVTIAEDADGRSAMAGGKKLAEFVKDYAGTDEGKYFVTAKSNSGTGAPKQPGSGEGKEQTQTSTQKIASGLAKLKT